MTRSASSKGEGGEQQDGADHNQPDRGVAKEIVPAQERQKVQPARFKSREPLPVEEEIDAEQQNNADQTKRDTG